MQSGFQEIYHPLDQNELALIKSVLDRKEIRYYINNENYSAMVPFAAVGARTMAVLVEAARSQEARDVLSEEIGLRFGPADDEPPA